MVAQHAAPVPETRSFESWCDDIEKLALTRQGLTLNALGVTEDDLANGYGVGDSPAEFYAGCVVDAASSRR